MERKGSGHPDTLADGLAEHLSVEYSLYTKNKFGVVLHHNFDKVGLLGGSSYVRFLAGHIENPIKVLLNGRASTKFGDTAIPVRDLLTHWSIDYLSRKLPLVNPKKDFEIHYNLSNKSSPGKTDLENVEEEGTRKYWFEPRDEDDIQELQKLLSNDTSLGVGFYPLTRLENFVLTIEDYLSSEEMKKESKWLGTDIKIMGLRDENTFDITMCIPQISRFVKDVEEYKINLQKAKEVVFRLAKEQGVGNIDLHLNTRDNFKTGELYLTAIGSSIESGDEGLVGRGNRINGLITPFRLMSMEGACGKNPVYHIGKIYYIAAIELAKSIYSKFGIRCETGIISQSGRLLSDPWVVYVGIPESFEEIEKLGSFVKSEIKKIPQITKGVLERNYRLY